MIRVLTVRDMLSHVCRRGHLTLRGVTISVGCRLVTLAPALLVSRQHFAAASRANMKGAGRHMQIAGVVQGIVSKDADSHRV